MNIVVLGYYDRGNLGDDIFKCIFTKFFDRFKDAKITIVNTDDIEKLPVETSIVVVGGGDLINDYFINKIKLLTTGFMGPIYAFGVGIPYPNMIEEGALDIFDFIVHRNPLEHERLLKRYPAEMVRCYPDLSYLMEKYIKPTPQDIFKNNGKKNIGIFLSRTMYNSEDPEAYEDIVSGLTTFIQQIADTRKGHACFRKRMYEVYLFSMNTGKNNDESDLVLNQELFKRVDRENVNIVYDTITPDKVQDIFENLYISICTRYHSHIFSLINNIPILSIYTTRKVDNVIKNLNLQTYAVKMPIDTVKLYPIDFDPDVAYQKFLKIQHNHKRYHNYLKSQNPNIDVLELTMSNVIHNKLKRNIHNYKKQKTIQVAYQIIKYLNLETERVGDLVNSQSIYMMYRIADKEITDEEKKFIAELITYTLFRQRKLSYNFGLEEQAFDSDYSLFKSVSWLIDDFYRNKTFVNTISDIEDIDKLLLNTVEIQDRDLCMDYFSNCDLRGYHRSGWQYVVENMYDYHNEQGILVDAFVDKTFGWYSDFLTKMGELPIQREWIGFIHHTANESYSENNIINVFKNRQFIASMMTCKGLFVMSEYLKKIVEENLHGWSKVPVFCIKHPTEVPDLTFDLYAFQQNPIKKIIQVGAWLRNTYGIYDLRVPSDFCKFALKGKNMNNYYISDDQMEQIKTKIYEVGCNYTEEDACCRVISKDPKHCNKYVTGLIDSISERHEGVLIIEKISDQEYDLLLSRNIVFINLVDASAANTIIECIMRNTPILVNKLPAVVEYLGEDYPFYYEDVKTAGEKLSMRQIEDAHEYLKDLDKTPLKIETFLSELVKCLS